MLKRAINLMPYATAIRGRGIFSPPAFQAAEDWIETWFKINTKESLTAKKILTPRCTYVIAPNITYKPFPGIRPVHFLKNLNDEKQLESILNKMYSDQSLLAIMRIKSDVEGIIESNGTCHLPVQDLEFIKHVAGYTRGVHENTETIQDLIKNLAAEAEPISPAIAPPTL